ncbi:MAG: RluA family pseudouridine synthase [Leptotrichiaceae bacterium]|nr:RluA family pseudouridine synthase [Leptotrichiaceae bacterium]
MEKKEEINLITVFSDDINERIDTFLSGKTDLTRSRVQQLIKEGNVKVNGRNIKSSYKTEENDKIEFIIPEIKEIEIKPENIKINIIYEDADIAVINKHAGLVVHPAQGHYSGTLVNAILYHIKDLSGINGEIRPGIVHRLDKDTSGLIVIAKNDKAHINLTKMFQEKKIKKTYLAILKGKLNREKGKIITRIGRDPNDRKKMSVIKDGDRGKTAITNYSTISRNSLFTLVRVYIETGRTHQIRVHMKYLGYPILGDGVYGRKDSEKRQMLHAYKLEFLHPVTGKPLKFISEIPDDFKNALKNSKLEFDMQCAEE